ncbi:MAG: hypothetical protein U9P37_00710, partial [Pseudomonadota bacterium]|nr:hypothetical protein [Pseudomonadota bacterium]
GLHVCFAVLRGGTLLTIARPVEEQLEFAFNAKLKNVPNHGDPASNFPRPPFLFLLLIYNYRMFPYYKTQ